ncbi:MAG: NADH-quinone oxidoreductase subunit NuoE [Pseudomonadales bacterium]|nr:NADH-quinone oxidoreductase subunit NuoE [Pseudomonadales bacterium]MCP5215753.1 NADH-quinone oxidoreductase subunit NuoE [Pseudomonadales bacterium]
MEPITALSAAEIAEIKTEASHYEQPQAASIEALKIVQKYRGWVSDESVKAIAQLLQMSPAELDGVATFYNLIFRRPVGKHVLMLCDSVSCWIMGCDGVGAQLKKQLGIEFGETTADGQFTLLPVTCQGACDRAPVMLVDGALETHLDVDKINAILANQK